MNAKEAIEPLKWYFERDDGIAAEMITKEAYQIAVRALEEIVRGNIFYTRPFEIR